VVLKEEAMRLRSRREDISVILPRAGEASCMYHAGSRTDEIQRRGRWASDAYKVHMHEGGTMTKAGFFALELAVKGSIGGGEKGKMASQGRLRLAIYCGKVQRPDYSSSFSQIVCVCM
jgi:hypothetical protein